MVLLADKYRPKSLGELEFHTTLSQHLKLLADSGDLPHMLFYGPSGAGKKTRMLALLKELYGPGVEKVKASQMSFEVETGSSKKKLEVPILSSNFHIELNPGEMGSTNDRHVIQHAVKEIAATHAVNEKTQSKCFKVVVLHEVDRLSKGAQHALRRTMEKYTAACRIIMVCESASRVTAPLKSRALLIRVPAPTAVEVTGVLQRVATGEGWKLPAELAERITVESQRNLRKALLLLEACKVQTFPFTPEQKVRTADWELFIDDLAKSVCEEQSPTRLYMARNKMYELLINCIPPEVIIKNLTTNLLRRVDDEIRHKIIREAAFYEHRMQLGNKPIYHLEAFVAKFMAIYKRWVVESFG